MALSLAVGMVGVALAALVLVVGALPAASTAAQIGGYPSATPSATPVKYYIVAPAANGHQEYLYEIAVNTLGNGKRFNEIFDLNQGRLQPDGSRLTDPMVLHPGWILLLPADAQGVGVLVGIPPTPPAAVASAESSVAPGPATDARQPTQATVAAIAPADPGGSALAGAGIRVGALLVAALSLAMALRLVRGRGGVGAPGSGAPSTPHQAPRGWNLTPGAGPTQPPRHAPDRVPALSSGPGLAERPRPRDTAVSVGGAASGMARRDAHFADDSAVAAADGTASAAMMATSRVPRAEPQVWSASAEPAASRTSPALSTDEHPALTTADGPVAPTAAGGAVTTPVTGSMTGPTIRPELLTSLTHNGQRLTVRLTGTRGGRREPAYAWLAPGEAAPPSALPVVLGDIDGWWLHADLSASPDLVTVTGSLRACHRFALDLAEQVGAAGLAVTIVGDAIGTRNGADDWLRAADLSTMDGSAARRGGAGIVICADLGGVALLAARQLLRDSGGRVVPIVIGAVLSARWSVRLEEPQTVTLLPHPAPFPDRRAELSDPRSERRAWR